jgi:hypothetical protein
MAKAFEVAPKFHLFLSLFSFMLEGGEETRPERGVGKNEIRNVTQCKHNEESGTNLMA